ncbi:MAG: HlyD family efflux transporter periplasmic adaptor subunit [Gemmatimonadetes bacterium]|nr:HlyD family efflux transporter periplasmic adaptor subunit [Gemmatimonadota bacterium]
MSRRRQRATSLLAGVAACLGLAACDRAPPDLVVATGTVEALEVDVGPQVGGRVVELRVQQGDVVAPGDTLALLARTELPGELAAARARVELARARLLELEAGPRLEEIAAARAALRGAESELAQAARELKRIEELVAGQLAPPQEWDRAATALDLARSRRDMARQTLVRLEAGTRPEQLAAARAELAAAEAAQAQARAAAAELLLLSPRSGQVLLRNFEAGEVVGAGAPVVTLIDPDSLWMRIYVDQRDLARLRTGQPAEIRADALPDRVFAARVVEIAPRAEFTPRVALTEEERAHLVFGVKLLLADPAGVLKPGMPAEARIAAGDAAAPALGSARDNARQQ